MDYDNGIQDLDQYRIFARREVLALLRSLKDHNQLVSMMIRGGSEAVVTSLLDVDEAQNLVVVDCAPKQELNDKILAANKVSFETLLDHIRILFSTDAVQRCTYDDLPALCFPIPESVIRLQRREFYRVATPVATPVRCMMPLKTEDSGIMNVPVTLYNISAGGVAVIDEKKLLDNTIGLVYDNCRLDLPGVGPLTVRLQVRNSMDLSLTSGKSIRRIGCMFVDLPQAYLAAVQRYITKLERERNARMHGMG